jgi:hypothetical protein
MDGLIYSLQVSQRPDSQTSIYRQTLMSVVFALTIKNPILSMKVYKNNSHVT